MASTRERGVPWFYPPLEWIVATRPGGWFYTRVAMRIDRWLMPRTNGRIRMSLMMPSGLLICRGAKSGAERRIPLLYVPLGEGRVVVIASNAGQRRHPAWYFNLRAHPEVSFMVRGAPRAYRARLVSGPEREEIWTRAIRQYAGWTTYENRTADTREIPVFVLDPVT